jgi:hypothetical protein
MQQASQLPIEPVMVSTSPIANHIPNESQHTDSSMALAPTSASATPPSKANLDKIPWKGGSRTKPVLKCADSCPARLPSAKWNFADQTNHKNHPPLSRFREPENGRPS